MSDSSDFFPHVRPRTDGDAALKRFRAAHEGQSARISQVEHLGAQALVSAAAVLGVDPVTLGFGLRDGQIASALTAGEPLVSAEIAERRLEMAIACIAGWAEGMARTVRSEGGRQADRFARLAGEVRQEWGRMQNLLCREGVVRQTRAFSPSNEPNATIFGQIDAEAGLRQKVAALHLQLEHVRSEADKHTQTAERLVDELLRAKGQLQDAQMENERLRRAVDGWKAEAEAAQRRWVLENMAKGTAASTRGPAKDGPCRDALSLNKPADDGHASEADER